jgi:hypothetical protein
MSGMSSMLRIALDRDASPHHEPNETGNCRSGRYYPEELLPLSQARFCTRSLRRPGWILRMSLMPLMGSTPGVLDARSGSAVV